MSDSSQPQHDSTVAPENPPAVPDDVNVTQPLATFEQAESLIRAYQLDESTEEEGVDSPVSSEQAVAQQTNVPAEGPTVGAADPSSEPAEEFSIDEYMSSLLQRYGGGSEATDREPEQKAHGGGSCDQAQNGTEADVAEMNEPSEWVPSKAPEGKEDLEALRRVANSTARGAVSCHLARQLVNHTSIKLTLAVSAACASFACLMASSHVPNFRMAALVAAVGSIFWAGQFFSLTAQLAGLVEVFGSSDCIDSEELSQAQGADRTAQADLDDAS